jgi:transposase
MINMHKKQEIIIRSYRNGESISRIAREVAVCRKTVRKYIHAYSEEKKKLVKGSLIKEKELIEEITKPPQYNSSNRKKRKITNEMVLLVKECLEENRKKQNRGQHKQRMKKIDILEYLQEKEFVIGYTSICNLINRLEQRHAETFIKQKYQPGNVCEFDWGESKIFINDKLRYLQLAIFTSAYGNYRYALLYPKQNTQCFQEAHSSFFDHLGGVYRTLVYDNMKVAVRKFIGRCEKEATDGLLKLSMYYNFAFRFCNIRAGNEKGHVERSVEYVRRKAFSRRDHFSSLEEANEYLLSVCEKLNQRPQAGNQNKSALEIMKTEKEHLLPSLPKFECAGLSDLRVDKYSTIIVDNCHYSVPEEYTGKMITAKIYSSEIICYDEHKKICIHMKSHGCGDWIINIEHYLKSLKKKPGAVVGSVAFSQMNNELQMLYRKHFQSDAKDFVELLIYMKGNDKNLQEIQTIVHRLENLCPKDISTDKIKLISERKNEENDFQQISKIEEVSICQLSHLALLLPQKNNLNTYGGIL